ncbi:MAG TPA: NEL-type E3 ubiquitin ligase domain-containing protein, partial [Rhabdochlamydiaceae bacterium]|nr:NEL-type E3 ubiquitin ligase domain-containing protein [Rhabdochlamydiaceae bacterium]
KGNLNLAGCTGLTALPEGLTVHGDLNLNNCTGFTALPEGLTVKGNLNLSYCTGLTALSMGLTVKGDLDLSCCTGLTALPEGLTVHGDLYLSYCRGLTALPNWITTLGPRADGNIRHIYLDGIGLSEALLNRLRETPALGIFLFSNAAAVPTQIFPNLDAALTFWVQATGNATLANPPITIASATALGNVLRFLSRLTETAEYKNSQARPVLAQRVIEAFSLMAEDESIKGRALDLIREGLASCDDRIISALEEIELMVLLHQIENTPHTEAQLKELGKSFLLLEMVNEKARAHKNTLTWVDEIEIYLAFQIGLAERLNLPVKTRNMIFRRCAQVTDQQISQAGDAVVKECTEEKLNDFLKSWSPWIAHQRKNGPVPAYEELPVVSRKLEKGEVCPFTQEIPEKPVLCGKAVYEYGALIHCYRASGINPIDRSTIDLKTLIRVVFSEG